MRIALLTLALAALTAAPAAAHDAPLALVEAMEAHLLDCPRANGAMPGGDMLSAGWERLEPEDPLLVTRTQQFMGDAPTWLRNANLYRRQSQGLELIQFMGARSKLPADYEGDAANAPREDHTTIELECITMVPDLPFMPSGRLLAAMFGKEVDFGTENTPGDTRIGAWFWEDITATHLRTVASYTDAQSAERLLEEERVFYRGFYISSLHRFTPEQTNPTQSIEESEQ